MSEPQPENWTPARVVEELDRHIIGQKAAKRAVAIALRNRWRRQMLDPALREDVYPKNLILIGPTGVGKTEIARRIARLSRAPFVKVEVSKFTEVGYVGRDVDSILRDLVEVSHKLVKEEMERDVQDEAKRHARDHVLDILLPPIGTGGGGAARFGERAGPGLGTAPPSSSSPEGTATASNSASRERLRERLEAGDLDDREIEIELEEEGTPLGMQSMPGMPPGEALGSQLQGLLGAFGRRTRKRKLKISDAIAALTQQEAGKLVDGEALRVAAVHRAEQFGVVFLDEIDKVCAREGQRGADISREGVQRDLLPLVEGSTVATKYGSVRSDHVLFIAAGAFHTARVSDLIPELQGRFPIRVELESLGVEEFVRILQEPAHSLLKQSVALLGTEGVELIFDQDAIVAMAEFAAAANAQLENIGARRLHTVLERVLEELSYSAADLGPQQITITRDYVARRLADLIEDRELSRHIL